MLRGIIILIISVVCTNSYGQKNFADSLLILEEQFYKATDQIAKQHILLEKFQLYMDRNDFSEEGLRVAERVNCDQLDSNEARIHFWNMALYSYVLRKYDKASSYLNDFYSSRGVHNLDEVFLSYLITVQLDTTKANVYLKELVERDTSFSCLKCISEVQDYVGKKPGPYVLSSAIVPGSGMIAHGNVGKGLVSLGIHGGIVAAVVAMARWNVYFNAVSWGLTLFQKFYFGNLKLTNKLIENSNKKAKKKVSDNCELSLQETLKKFPLHFK
ncbi:MAG: hypothetical protein ACKVOK_13320 [Flavobacteriales bacterium]